MLGVVASNGEKCAPINIKKKEKVKTEVYISLFKKHVVPRLKKTFPNGNYVFQQDGDLSHGPKNGKFLAQRLLTFHQPRFEPT